MAKMEHDEEQFQKELEQFSLDAVEIGNDLHTLTDAQFGRKYRVSKDEVRLKVSCLDALLKFGTLDGIKPLYDWMAKIVLQKAN